MTNPHDVAAGIVPHGGIESHHATEMAERGANLVGGIDSSTRTPARGSVK